MKGRKRVLTDDEVTQARELYFRVSAPNGRSYSFDAIGRLLGVSAATVENAVKGRGTYQKK
jgi:hypothetical protein